MPRTGKVRPPIVGIHPPAGVRPTIGAAIPAVEMPVTRPVHKLPTMREGWMTMVSREGSSLAKRLGVLP